MESERPALWLTHEGESPRLRGVHCGGCGTNLFPPQSYGCTVCGAFGDQLEACELLAEGTVLSFAEVHLHQGVPVPFTLAEIGLDSGPVVRARVASGATPAIGQRATGVVVTEGEERTLEFAVAPGGSR